MSAVMEDKTFRGLREIALLSVIAGALFFLISLITFRNDDAGWTHSGSIQTIANAGGVFGAWIADFMLSFFGLCAYLFPFVLIWQGYLTYSQQSSEQSRWLMAIQWFGAMVSITSADALFSFYFLHLNIELPHSAGGILGQEFGAFLAVAFGNTGATLLLLVILFASLRLFTEISVVSVLDFVGKHSFNFSRAFYQTISKTLQQHRSTLELQDVVVVDDDAVVNEKKKEKTPRKRGFSKINPVAIPKHADLDNDAPSDFDEFFDELEDDVFEETGTKAKPVKKLKHQELENTAANEDNAGEVINKKLTSFIEKVKIAKAEVIDKVAEKKALKAATAKKVKAPHYPKRNKLPTLDLLDERDTHVIGYSESDLEEMSRLVEDILNDFNVTVTVVGFHPGPVITRFEVQPAAGVKVSRISGLSKDLARALSVTSVRIVEIIPGKSVIGLEIPNQEREMVTLRELLKSTPFEYAKSYLTLALGKDIAGVPMVADLAKMPHALVAGTTGSGKSVAINTMILSLLYKASPEQVRLIMIDPKMLELSVYEGIPHLLTPVVTDMKEASNALRWAVGEMERRYKLMSKMGVRNLAGFNLVIEEAASRGETIRDPMFQLINPLEDGEDFPTLSTLPSIVIVIDELADMMMIVGKKVEELIARLAQKARAAGIHLILATQRPSVDVLTGLIKANVPTRISFQVSSRIDSRTILDQGGAETLLGNGDMLFLPSGTSIPIRAHGAFVDDHEVHRVVEFLKQTGPTNYLTEITKEVSDGGDSFGGGSSYGGNSESDPLYDEAVRFVTESRKASISSVQRRFKVGYNRAATIIEAMEVAGVVSTAENNGTRVVLAPPPV
ncbi:MAG: segregation ATPase FtsK/SpoIIIE, family [Pseudomonadota bacterium]|nr:segregation ATPase FtsK/SpoIIIE, family [Pseudomonadota bacterium]